MAQPDFAAEAANGNLSFRIPTPVFGAGLIENIADATILANLAASASRQLGIAGVPNRSGNDGSITRFGWKAQNKSLLVFAGEAYNVEMGVTNELFPNERGYPPNPIPPGCIFNPTPEDRTIFESDDPAQVLSDVNSFANFMRFLDQPIPACSATGTPCSPQIQIGQSDFRGHRLRELPHSVDDHSPIRDGDGLSQVPANLFSDLALHHMGRTSRTASRREMPARTSSARLRYGESASECSSCTMGAHRTCFKPSRSMQVKEARPTGSSKTTNSYRDRTSRA